MPWLSGRLRMNEEFWHLCYWWYQWVMGIVHQIGKISWVLYRLLVSPKIIQKMIAFPEWANACLNVMQGSGIALWNMSLSNMSLSWFSFPGSAFHTYRIWTLASWKISTPLFGLIGHSPNRFVIYTFFPSYFYYQRTTGQVEIHQYRIHGKGVCQVIDTQQYRLLRFIRLANLH
jgi:hypothetical protein